MIQHIEQIVELNLIMLEWCSKMSYEDQLLYLPKINESIAYAAKCIETAKSIMSTLK